MKYTNTSKFPKVVGNTGFYAIVAACLVAIGAASWFAVSRYNAMQEANESSSNPNAYSAPESSYNDITEQPQNTTENVQNEASDVPYSSEAEPEIKPEPEKRSYTLPTNGNILKGFSDTALQYSATHGDMRLHTGIDIICEEGADIKAVCAGTVVSVEESATLGRVITIDHGEGITVKYCGMGSVNVNPEDEVGGNTVIGTAGTVPSECADQSHIHIEVTANGQTVSPLSALGLES